MLHVVSSNELRSLVSITSNNCEGLTDGRTDGRAKLCYMMVVLKFIVKLGGAAVTDKASFETLNGSTLRDIAEHLRTVYEQHRTADFVVVHGAGSFGHFQASQAGVDKGGLHKPSVRTGFVETRNSVRKLNGMVVSALTECGIPAVGISLCGFWMTSERQVSVGPVEGIRKLLESGFIPVLHGECILDEIRGCTILSGDVIVKHLCSELAPEFVVFLTNVDGLFDRSPEERDANLIRQIVVRESGEWFTADGHGGTHVRFTTQEHDTTGGIHGKIMECADIARLGYHVFICKAGSESGQQILLKGTVVFESPRWRGTRISSVLKIENL